MKFIGNLTLTSGKLNAHLSNGPWEEKRTALDKHSTLALNKRLLEETGDVWDEETIRERSQQLARIVTELWPAGDKF